MKHPVVIQRTLYIVNNIVAAFGNSYEKLAQFLVHRNFLGTRFDQLFCKIYHIYISINGYIASSLVKLAPVLTH